MIWYQLPIPDKLSFFHNTVLILIPASELIRDVTTERNCPHPHLKPFYGYHYTIINTIGMGHHHGEYIKHLGSFFSDVNPPPLLITRTVDINGLAGGRVLKFLDCSR